jgi:hypothetical protein
MPAYHGVDLAVTSPAPNFIRRSDEAVANAFVTEVVLLIKGRIDGGGLRRLRFEPRTSRTVEIKRVRPVLTWFSAAPFCKDEPMIRYMLPALLLTLLGAAASADEGGSFSNDWTGNGHVVEAFADPQVAGVTCYVVHFGRSVIDRLTKGNWFENPSKSI